MDLLEEYSKLVVPRVPLRFSFSTSYCGTVYNAVKEGSLVKVSWTSRYGRENHLVFTAEDAEKNLYDKTWIIKDLYTGIAQRPNAPDF